MAVKNHALDERIILAAREEFLENGFQKASLHRIADRAGITTGALYTRYKSKDDLFCSLVQDVFTASKKNMELLYPMYLEAQESGDPNRILQVIHREEAMYLDLMFQHYDTCVLFFCRSGGSSLEAMISTMMQKKASQTVEYLKGLPHASDMDLDGVGMFIGEQFQFFRQILERGYSKEKAFSCMKTVECFLEAGWKAIFEALL